MKVILKEDVDNLGQLGDVKEVAAGYARNFLIPRGLVIAATPKNMAEVEHERRLIDAKIAARQAEAKKVSEKISSVTVTQTVKVGEDGKLFGSVTAKDLIAALGEHGIEVGRHAIVLEHPIKSVGEYNIEVSLGQGVTGSLKVSVVADQVETAEAADGESEEGEASA